MLLLWFILTCAAPSTPPLKSFDTVVEELQDELQSTYDLMEVSTKVQYKLDNDNKYQAYVRVNFICARPTDKMRTELPAKIQAIIVRAMEGYKCWAGLLNEVSKVNVHFKIYKRAGVKKYVA